MVSAQQYNVGQAECLDAPAGKSVFSLKDSSRFCAFPSNSEWVKVAIKVYVKNTDLVDGELVADAELLNESRQVIATSLQNMKVSQTAMAEGRKFKGMSRVVVEGVIHKTRLQRNTVPEWELADLLSVKMRSEQDERMNRLFESQKFEKRESDEFVFMVKRQDECTLEDEAPFRIIVVLRGSTVFAVLTNGTHFSGPKVKETRLEGQVEFVYFQKASPKVHEAISEMMYNYLPL